MPSDTVTKRRDRAVVAFILLTAARDAAAASMLMKHVDLTNRRVLQDAREVRTKGAKTFTSFFYPVGDLPVQVVSDWITELRERHLFGPSDPIFPASQTMLGADGLFESGEITRRAWTSAQPIREIFRRAFEGAGLPYYPPHTVRHALVALGYELDLSVKEFKAWSQNLGHESALTTLTSYGTIPVEEQGRLISNLSRRGVPGGETLTDLLSRAVELAARQTETNQSGPNPDHL
jgi:integrase